MAKQFKASKRAVTRAKGITALVVLVALTVFVSCLGLSGMKLDKDGVKVLLPWMPTSGENWPASLPLDRALGGGDYVLLNVVPAAAPAEGEAAPAPDKAQLEEAAKIMAVRLKDMKESDVSITVTEDNALRVEMRHMDPNRFASLLSMAAMQGKFEFRDQNGQLLFTEKEVKKVSSGYNRRDGYLMTLSLTSEGTAALAAAGDVKMNLTVDGSPIYGATMDAAKNAKSVQVKLGQDYNQASNLNFLLNTGSIPVQLTMGETGLAEASIGRGVLTGWLIASAVVILAAALYLLVRGKLTGLSGLWTLWCAVVLELFFFATIVVPSVSDVSVVDLIALLLGFVLAAYMAIARTEMISKQIEKEGSAKQANKLGFRVAAKNVWLAHAIVLAVSLILMIFPFSVSVGYALCTGVVASAFVAPLMRAFQMTFMAFSKKPALYGKAK